MARWPGPGARCGKPFTFAGAAGPGRWPGRQSVFWKAKDGSWTVVVMRADGRPGVGIHADLGARLPALRWVGIGAALAGLVFMAGGVLLILGAVRRRPPSAT